jgi:hypothetical protein
MTWHEINWHPQPESVGNGRITINLLVQPEGGLLLLVGEGLAGDSHGAGDIEDKGSAVNRPSVEKNQR